MDYSKVPSNEIIEKTIESLKTHGIDTILVDHYCWFKSGVKEYFFRRLFILPSTPRDLKSPVT